MTTESDQTQWSVAGLLELFDVQPNGPDRFTAETGIAGADERQVVEGTQVLAQAIVAAAKRFADKSVRSAHAVFSRAVMVGAPLELVIDVFAEVVVADRVLVLDRHTFQLLDSWHKEPDPVLTLRIHPRVRRE